MYLNDRDRRNDAMIYLHMDNDEVEESQIDVFNIVTQMTKKKKLYKYIFAIAVCVGVLLGLTMIGVDYVTGKNTYARAVISFQYEGIEDGLDPNGAAFDINKIKSPVVIEEALASLNNTRYDVEKIRGNIAIEGVIPEDAVERITVFKEMALDDMSSYEKILDVSYYPSQYIVYLYKDFGMSGTEVSQILNAILESYRTYFLDTYANTEVLTVTANLIDYKGYDYAEALDMLETQIELMQDYVSERRDQSPEFRSSVTGLSFSDIAKALDTVEGIGYGMVVYLATIMGIDGELYDAAMVDGANIFQRIRYITLPHLKPTFIILLLYSLGGIMRGQFELFYQMIGNNGVLFSTTDILDTYVFRITTTQPMNMGLGAAAGLFQSLFGFVVVMLTNWLVKRKNTEYALF